MSFPFGVSLIRQCILPRHTAVRENSMFAADVKKKGKRGKKRERKKEGKKIFQYFSNHWQ